MPDFIVLPAHVIDSVPVVAAQGAKNAAAKVAVRDGITAGRVAVIAVSDIAFKTIETTTSVDAADA